MDFDASLGFPGEGPSSLLISSFGFAAWSCLGFLTCSSLDLSLASPIIFLVMLGFPLLRLSPFRCSVSLGCTKGPTVNCRLLAVVGLCCFASAAAVSHGLNPRDAADIRRVRTRGDLELPVGRPVLGSTQAYRDKLLSAFGAWLNDQGFSLDEIITGQTIDAETVNLLLERYGRAMFRAGRPYGHYSETINAVGGKRPGLRRQLQPAWDVAYSWLRQEPPIHHVALPWQLLLALLVTSLSWGWTRVAGVIALSWGGITRIGEVLAASRKHLVLPEDLQCSINFALLEIQEPKTRFRTARHQSARVDQPQLLQILKIAFSRLLPEQKLWPFSGQTMRSRFQALLAAYGIQHIPKHLQRGLDLGSLRAGGASWLLFASEDSELVRRRGRWISSRVMEVYIQEVGSLQFLSRLDDSTRQLILQGLALFPWSLNLAVRLFDARVPETIWYVLFKNEADLDTVGELQREKSGQGLAQKSQETALTSPVHLRSCKERKWSASADLLTTNSDALHGAQAHPPWSSQL